jgi:hypothetical protein
MSRAKSFKQAEATKAARAMRAAGVESFDLTFDANGRPVIRVRPAGASETPPDVLDEIDAWAREA